MKVLAFHIASGTRLPVRAVGLPKHSVDRVLATRALVTATTELITGWLHGDIDTDEDTLVATITAVSLGAAGNI